MNKPRGIKGTLTKCGWCLYFTQKRAGGSPCLQAWGGSSRPIDTKTTQYVDLQFIDFRYKICYNFSSEKR